MSILPKLVAALTLFITLQVSAEDPCRESQTKIHSFRKIKKELGLTSEQTTQLKSVPNSGKQQIIKKRKAMDEAQAVLETALASDETEEQIRTKFDDLQKRQDEYSRARFESIMQVRSVLTPDQKIKFKAAFGKK